MIKEEGFYRDTIGDIWRFKNLDRFSNLGSLVLRRTRDQHAGLFMESGKHIEPEKPSIVKYLSKEDYPELYL